MKFFLTAIGKFCCRTIRGLNSTAKKAKKIKKQPKKKSKLTAPTVSQQTQK